MADTALSAHAAGKCRLAAVAVMRWLPLALTGHDATEDVSAHGGAAARRPVLNA